MGYKVAVVGATGNVGREMLTILAERAFPADEVVALASRRSIGHEVSFGDKTLKVKALEHLRLFRHRHLPDVGGRRRSRRNGRPRSARKARVVIDNSSAWRYDSDVPLIVPEVNADAVEGFTQAQHHRQPELLDGAARRGAEAAARRGDDQARRGRDLSIGLRRRQGRHGRALRADARGVHRERGEDQASSRSASPSTSFRISTSSWRTARPRKSGR